LQIAYSGETVHLIPGQTEQFFVMISDGKLYQLLIYISLIFFCHIERSRDEIMVLDCARTDNWTDLQIELVLDKIF
jgi:hypothetical protein